MMPRLHFVVWNRLFQSRSWSLWQAAGLPASPCARFFSSLPPNSHEIENTEGTSLKKKCRQVSKAIKFGQEDLAVTLIQSFLTLENLPSVAFCNYILNSCARAGNSKIAKDVRSFMLQNGVSMNEVSYACFLRALCRDGQLDKALLLLEALAEGKEAVLPNTIICNIVLNGCFHAKSKLHTDKCLKLMSTIGVRKDEMTYVELMKLSGVLQDLNGVHKWWDELKTICAPSPSSRCVLIVALCRTKSLNDALAAMKDMSDAVSDNRAQTRLPGKKTGSISDVTSESLAKKYISKSGEEVSTDLAKKQSNESFLQCSYDMEKRLEGFEGWEVRKELQDSMNALINAAGHGGDHLMAESLFSKMRRLGLRLSIYTYNALLRAVVKGRGVQHGLRIIRAMEATGVTPDTCTFTALVDGYCQAGELEKAESLLYRLQEGKPDQWPSKYTYNILLKACGRMVDPERALRVFAKMKEADVAPDSCTYIALLGACGNVNVVNNRDNRWSRQEVAQRLLAIETDMARSGVPHTRESVSALLKVLGDEGMLEVLMQRLRTFRSSDDNFSSSFLDASSYNSAMHGCVKAKQLDVAWEIFDEMRALGISPNCETFNILIDACSYKRSLAEAFELVDIMHQEGIQPDRVTYNSLIKVTCHSGEIDVGVEILKKMRSYGIHPDIRSYNTILSSAAHHKRLDLTEFLIEDMRCWNVIPDDHSCLQVVAAYVNCGEDENAAEALRVVSARMLANKVHEDVTLDSSIEGGDDSLLEDISLDDPINQARYISRLAALAHGADDSWTPECSPWASRVRLQYEGRTQFS